MALERTIKNAVAIAIDYLYSSEKRTAPIDNFRLNKRLHAKLCKSIERLSIILGDQNIENKDIYMLVESWIIAQETHLDALVALKSPF